jgi:hypothetical protein
MKERLILKKKENIDDTILRLQNENDELLRKLKKDVKKLKKLIK